MRNPMFMKSQVEMNESEGSAEHLSSDTYFFNEQFKALRAKIDDYFDKDGKKTLAITSAIAEEGKTLASVNLALNIASTGRKKVLLVDADMRKSDIAKGMNLKQVPGLSEYLSGSAKFTEVVRNSKVPGLHVIPSGKEPLSASDMLAGKPFRSFLMSTKEHFDLIIFDTPPVLPVSDTLSLREQVDWFLMVFRARFTPYPMLKQIVAEIGEEKILGVVINRVEPMSGKYYQRYYGKYYKK